MVDYEILAVAKISSKTPCKHLVEVVINERNKFSIKNMALSFGTAYDTNHMKDTHFNIWLLNNNPLYLTGFG